MLSLKARILSLSLAKDTWKTDFHRAAVLYFYIRLSNLRRRNANLSQYGRRWCQPRDSTLQEFCHFAQNDGRLCREGSQYIVAWELLVKVAKGSNPHLWQTGRRPMYYGHPSTPRWFRGAEMPKLDKIDTFTRYLILRVSIWKKYILHRCVQSHYFSRKKAFLKIIS